MEANSAPKHQLKAISPKSLYNLAQDGKPLVIVDLRPRSEFLESFVRRSYNFDPLSKDTTQDDLLIEFIKKNDENATINEQKYKIARVRRVAFILETSDAAAPAVKEEVQNSGLFDSFDQKFIMTDGFQKFRAKYPFLTISVPQELQQKPFQEIQDQLLETQQADLLFANASFPLEIIEDSVYLGKFFHAENKRLIEALNIGLVIDFQKKEKGNAELTPIPDRKNHYRLEVDLDSFIDFDGIYDSIVVAAEGKRMLFMGDSLDLPAGFLVGYLMKRSKQSLNFASMVVFGAVGETQVDRLLYNQLMNYQPGKLTFVKI
jgi:hypothetical protein